MKKAILMIAIAGIVVIAGLVLVNRIKEDKSPKTKDSQYVFGVQCGAFNLNKKDEGYNEENTKKKIDKLKELGVNTVRANLEIKTSEPYAITPLDDVNDRYINALTENGFDVLLVIDPDIPSTINKANYEKEGYNIASYVTERYKGKIKYYQLANEVSGSTVKPSDPNFNGTTFKDDFGLEYSKERYEAVLGWTKGMSRAIREKDSSAKIVLSGHWVLYEVIDRLQKDGVDFDILGWAWYENDGDDTTKRESPDGKSTINLAEELFKFGKPLWIIESNLGDGTYPQNGESKKEIEKKQAEFIKSFVPKTLSNGFFSGFFFFTLFDDPVAGEIRSEREGHWGLVEVKKIGEKNQITGNKPGFDAYKKVINSTR